MFVRTSHSFLVKTLVNMKHKFPMGSNLLIVLMGSYHMLLTLTIHLLLASVRKNVLNELYCDHISDVIVDVGSSHTSCILHRFPPPCCYKSIDVTSVCETRMSRSHKKILQPLCIPTRHNVHI